MAETNGLKPLTPPPTPTPAPKPVIVPKIFRRCIKICRIIGKVIASVALWELAGYWQPEFRTQWANVFEFLDIIAKAFNSFIGWLF